MAFKGICPISGAAGSIKIGHSEAPELLIMDYISVHLYRKMLDQALREGMTANDLQDLPTPPEALDGIQAVPADHFFALHERLDSALGPGFSVRVGRQMRIEDYGVLGLSWRTCSRAGEIFERSERYFVMLSNTYVFKVEQEHGLSNVYLLRDAYRRGVELSNEATFSATVVVLQAMTERDIAPVGVSFRHRPPRDWTSYREAFPCPIQFDQPYNCITYRTKDLETRTAKADQRINAYLLERVKEETEGIEVSPGKIVEDVECLIRDALPGGIPTVSQLGKELGMSPRTLTRRLATSGITFRDLIQSTKREIALKLLMNSSQSVGEIAFLTGFSEQSAFNRAFRRWTGQSPTAFRKG